MIADCSFPLFYIELLTKQVNLLLKQGIGCYGVIVNLLLRSITEETRALV